MQCSVDGQRLKMQQIIEDGRVGELVAKLQENWEFIKACIIRIDELITIFLLYIFLYNYYDFNCMFS